VTRTDRQPITTVCQIGLLMPFKTVVMMAASAASKACKAGLRCNLTKQCRSPSNGALVDLREGKVFPALHFRHLGKVAADRDRGVDTHRR
jgi:hypothetical protein